MNNIYKIGIARGVDVQALYATGSYAMRRKKFQFDRQLMLRTKFMIAGGEEGGYALTLVPAVLVPVRAGGRAEGGGFVFFGSELPGRLDFELNVGGLSETDPDTGRRHAVPVVTSAVTRQVAGPLSVFGEIYTESLSNDWKRVSSTIDSGFLVRLGNDAQIDLGAYTGVTGDVPAITPFLGFSARE